jgi:quercetin dioxygenase-like cupin family protein
MKGTSMTVAPSDLRKRRFLGIDLIVLSHGERLMMAKMLYKANDRVPIHKHPNEQCGYVLSGKYRLRFGENDRELTSGDSYCIPHNVEHCFEIIEPGEVLDCFSPLREDYL